MPTRHESPGLVDSSARVESPAAPAEGAGVATGIPAFELSDADRLSALLHGGRPDKSGRSAIEHSRSVSRITKALGGSTAQQIAALLHDVVEDTPCSLPDLRAYGVPEAAVRLVDALTQRTGEDFRAYLERIAGTPGAVLVKRADLAHNTDPARLAGIDDRVRGRLERKYAQARAVLDAITQDAIAQEMGDTPTPTSGESPVVAGSIRP